MYDKEMIRKVCDLTCSKEEVVRNQTTIKYDTEHPFKTYYNVSTITGAITKYISKEWDDQTLAHWACIYCWILSGGFDDNVKEDLDTFEGFFRDVVTWDLDGLSFFSAEDDESEDMHECIKLFAVEKNRVVLDNVLKRIPYTRILVCLFYLLYSILNSGNLTHLLKALNNEGLEELECHFLRKTTLIDLKLRTDNDNRTSGVVNTLTEKVLTEASLLTAKHFGK